MAGFFDTLFGGGAEKEAAAADKAALGTYQNTALPALQQGYTTGSGALNSAVGAYTPLANLGATYSSGAPTLMNALGVNGPQGNADATSAFQAGPGYKFQLDQGLDAIARQNAVGGMGASGNALAAANTYAQGQANQSFQQWLTNLQTAGNTGVNATAGAAQGQAAGFGSLANLATQYGEDQSGVASNVASGTIGANNLQAAGEAAGAKNLLGAGLSLGSLALGGMGGFGGGSALGNLTSKLGVGNMFMGGGSPSGY